MEWRKTTETELCALLSLLVLVAAVLKCPLDATHRPPFIVFIDRDVIDPSLHCFFTSGSIVHFLLLSVENESKTKSAAGRCCGARKQSAISAKMII